jgi:ABC-type branched-subunit amino acid transport system permease subunit
MLQTKNLWWLPILAVFTLFPLVVTNPANTSIGVFTLLYMASATSWNMFSGYSGYISLCSAVFYGMGAYTMALISIHAHMAPGAAMFWLVPLGGVAASAVALPIGWLALRVRRHTFVVITIAIFFVFQNMALNFSFTGGTAGLALPFITWDASYYNVPFYYVALGLVIFITIISAAVRRSRFGLQLLAIRDDEDRALGLGVKVAAVKAAGVTLSACTIGMVRHQHRAHGVPRGPRHSVGATAGRADPRSEPAVPHDDILQRLLVPHNVWCPIPHRDHVHAPGDRRVHPRPRHEEGPA